MIDEDLVRAHRARALNRRTIPSSAARRRIRTFSSRRGKPCNPFYLAAPTIVQNAMDKFAAIVGRQYHLFDYVGAPDAERVIVMMGSGAEVAAGGRRRPERRGREGRAAESAAVPAVLRSSISLRRCRRSVKSIAVLDRTKEPGATGEPLYLDVVTALAEDGHRRSR